MPGFLSIILIAISPESHYICAPSINPVIIILCYYLRVELAAKRIVGLSPRENVKNYVKNGWGFTLTSQIFHLFPLVDTYTVPFSIFNTGRDLYTDSQTRLPCCDLYSSFDR